MSNTATMDAKTMQELLAADGGEIKVPKAGDVIEGTVLTVAKNEVYVDIQGIRPGVVAGLGPF